METSLEAELKRARGSQQFNELMRDEKQQPRSASSSLERSERRIPLHVMVPFTLHADAQRILHDVSRILPVELRALDASLPVEHGALLRCSEWARSAAGQAAMKRAGIGASLP